MLAVCNIFICNIEVPGYGTVPDELFIFLGGRGTSYPKFNVGLISRLKRLSRLHESTPPLLS